MAPGRPRAGRYAVRTHERSEPAPRLRVDDFDYDLPRRRSPRCRWSRATPRACSCSTAARRAPADPHLRTGLPRARGAAAPRGPAGGQRLARHPGSAAGDSTGRRAGGDPGAATDPGRSATLGGAGPSVTAHDVRRAPDPGPGTRGGGGAARRGDACGPLRGDPGRDGRGRRDAAPPYIRDRSTSPERYQTVYASPRLRGGTHGGAALHRRRCSRARPAGVRRAT